MKAFEGKLGEKALAQEEMKSQIDKNITLQETFEMLKPILWFNGTEVPLPNSFEKGTVSPQLRNFVGGLDIYIKYSTTNQREQRKKNVKTLGTIFQKAKENKFGDNHSELFGGKGDTQSCLEMLINTQQLLKWPQPTLQNPDLNLFDILFTHCIPKHGEEGEHNDMYSQRLTDFMLYNGGKPQGEEKIKQEDKCPSSLAPIITSREKATATPQYE